MCSSPCDVFFVMRWCLILLTPSLPPPRTSLLFVLTAFNTFRRFPTVAGGFSRLPTATNAFQRQQTATNANQRITTPTNAYPPQPTTTKNYQRLPTTTNTHQRLSTATNGYQRLTQRRVFDTLRYNGRCRCFCQADENLSHLDGIVSAALAAGAVGYSPPAEADGDSDDEEASAMGGAGGSSFNLTPYARPSQVRAELRCIAFGVFFVFVLFCIVPGIVFSSVEFWLIKRGDVCLLTLTLFVCLFVCWRW